MPFISLPARTDLIAFCQTKKQSTFKKAGNQSSLEYRQEANQKQTKSTIQQNGWIANWFTGQDINSTDLLAHVVGVEKRAELMTYQFQDALHLDYLSSLPF